MVPGQAQESIRDPRTQRHRDAGLTPNWTRDAPAHLHRDHYLRLWRPIDTSTLHLPCIAYNGGQAKHYHNGC